MQKREIGVICSMSYYEMKLMTCALSRILLENEVRGNKKKKSITNLIGKLNGMLTKQGFKNAWTYKWSRNILFLGCGSYYCNTLYTMGE